MMIFYLMHQNIERTWAFVLEKELKKDYFLDLMNFVEIEYSNDDCYPPADLIFNSLNITPYNEVKVVILGQDPYHGVNQANGLCFSVNDGLMHPPSLRNIFKEVKSDLDIEIPKSGNLTRWAEQGVLLLNATLTVRAKQAGSHQKKGWEQFTDSIIRELNANRENVVFILWGAYAQKKGKIIDREKHLVLTANHPSPLSANRGGWFGQKHFSKTNEYLVENNIIPIIW